ncbi:hypothetical protein EZV62_019189 [Acer yangbiense]|uniref:Glycosyl hydrolase family 32 N-terminal domain-containing protein n=1 Tax=Acer yangbiense TaxID=1000413 RepID=A0A5C7H9R4_9ROSI|nr:hypothetical protein EZV62_019189 [Acer yangbiense]
MFLTKELMAGVVEATVGNTTGTSPTSTEFTAEAGPMVYKGIYHLFYQYNPKGAADIKGCWSGSATILLGGKPVILYTGIDSSERQVQNLAMPKNLSDPYLIEWVKYLKNPPMLATPMNRINGSAFRDPTTAWLGPDKLWRVLVGSRNNRVGVAYLYKSKDFVHWTLAEEPLHSAEGTGMWECPDFFSVKTDGFEGLDTSARGKKVKYVLKNSLDETKHDYYTIGTYDVVKDKYFPDKGMVEGDAGLRYDYGKFYASKTFFDDEKNMRILWGWTNESSSVKDDILNGWSGILAISRSVWLDKSGKTLLQWPVKEIKKLRENQVKWPSKILEGGSKLEVISVTAEQIDRSIVESFGRGGKVVISSRVYPTLAIDNQIKLFVFNNGTSNVKITSLNAWSMKKAQIS